MLWKSFFDLLDNELRLMLKKRRALVNLVNTGRISKFTFDYIKKDLSSAIFEIENRKKSLTERMLSRSKNLEEQIKSFEIFYANLEMHYVAGELQEMLYKRQHEAIALGLEATRRELSSIKEALANFIPQKRPQNVVDEVGLIEESNDVDNIEKISVEDETSKKIVEVVQTGISQEESKLEDKADHSFQKED